MAVREGMPTARHIPAPNMAYSVQSPLRFFATLLHVAIACENSVARMFWFTHFSTAHAFCHAVAVAGRFATACVARCLVASLSQSMKKQSERNSAPGFAAGTGPSIGPRMALTCSSNVFVASSRFFTVWRSSWANAFAASISPVNLMR